MSGSAVNQIDLLGLSTHTRRTRSVSVGWARVRQTHYHRYSDQLVPTVLWYLCFDLGSPPIRGVAVIPLADDERLLGPGAHASHRQLSAPRRDLHGASISATWASKAAAPGRDRRARGVVRCPAPAGSSRAHPWPAAMKLQSTANRRTTRNPAATCTGASFG